MLLITALFPNEDAPPAEPTDGVFAMDESLIGGPDLEEESMQFLRTSALPNCTRCDNRFITFDFVCFIRGYIYNLCRCCGKLEGLEPTQGSCLYSKHDVRTNGLTFSLD